MSMKTFFVMMILGILTLIGALIGTEITGSYEAFMLIMVLALAATVIGLLGVIGSFIRSWFKGHK